MDDIQIKEDTRQLTIGLAALVLVVVAIITGIIMYNHNKNVAMIDCIKTSHTPTECSRLINGK